MLEEATRTISAPTIQVKPTPGVGDIDMIERTRVTMLTKTLRESWAKSYCGFFWFRCTKALEGTRWLVKREDLRIVEHSRQ